MANTPRGGGLPCKKCDYVGQDPLDLARHSRKLHPKRKRKAKPEPEPQVQLDGEIWLANEAIGLFEGEDLELDDDARVRVAEYLVARYRARAAA